MRTKPVWKKNRMVWKMLPENARYWYWLKGKPHIAMRYDSVFDFLWDNNSFRKFRPRFPRKRVGEYNPDKYNSIWCH